MDVIEASLNEAIAYQQQGHFEQAEAIYTCILKNNPRNGDALHLLGLLYSNQQAWDQAESYLSQAIAVQPNPLFYDSLGVVLEAQGKWLEAIHIYQKMTVLDPLNAKAHYYLGNLYYQVNQLEASERAFLDALCLDAENETLWFHLGNAFYKDMKWDEALKCFENAVKLNPQFIQSWNNLGLIYSEKAIFDQAAVCYQQALALDPTNIDASTNLGGVFLRNGNYEKLQTHYEAVLKLDPHNSEAYINLGSGASECGEFEKALAYFNQAIAIDPQNINANWNSAATLLAMGNFEAGWPQFEWRFKLRKIEKLAFSQPEWNGSAQPTATILIYAEGGYGDVFQFYRFLPQVVAQCQQVIFYSYTVCTSLLKATAIDNVLVIENNQPLPHFDFHLPVMSLARVFKTDLNHLPASVPYLQPKLESAASWAEYFDGFSKLKVGLAWAGSPTNIGGQHRKCPVHYLAPLAALADEIQFFSVQKSPTIEEDLKSLPEEFAIINLDLAFNRL